MLNTPRRPPYAQQVPAVRRAAQVLECLAAAGEPLSLAALSRGLGVGASSLLAILTTLRGRGLVARSEADGRYEPGPGLAALGAAARRRLAPMQVFQRIAGRLAGRVGDTVVLWVRHEAAFVLAAAEEGSHPLRFVPPLGLQVTVGNPVLARLLTAVDRAQVVDGELQLGVWMQAIGLPSLASREEVAIAIAGPPSRLQGAAGAEARRALVEAIDEVAGRSSGPLANWEHAGPIGPAELDAFLRQALVTNLSYVSDDGYPATVPLWYVWDGIAFWLAPRPGSEWAEHVRVDPRVSLAVSESSVPLRRVLVRGRVEQVEDPSGTKWRDIELQLAERYSAFDAARQPAGPSQRRAPLRLVPEQLIAWRGLLRHPGSAPQSRTPLTPGSAGVSPAHGQLRRAERSQPRPR